MLLKPCRSELAREKPENAAECQAASVIVDNHRERARSYKGSQGSYSSKMITERASSPRRSSSNASLICSSLMRWEIISSSLSLPAM